MSPTVPIALFGWPLVILGLFALLPPRRAVIVAMVTGWLFLPMASYDLPGFPDYNKVTATTIGVLAAVAMFDTTRLLSFQPRWFDLPILVWCLVPFATSLSNGLGAYDGASGVAYQTMMWGVPYLLGRLYFNDLQGLRELAIGVFVGGLIYVPFCLYEIRMSPQLHNLVYGFHQHGFTHVRRFGGWRPQVFMKNGLALGLWMSIATLVGLWLWRSGSLRRLAGFSTGWMVSGMVVVTLLCKSLGAVGLLGMGAAALFAGRWLRTPVLLVCLTALPVAYMVARTNGLGDPDQLVSMAEMIHEQRAQSLEYRLNAEEILLDHAFERPMLGWGGWGRNRPARMGGNARDVATDGLWIITFGQHGLIGLASLTAVVLVPAFLICQRVPAMYWSRPRYGALVVLAVVLVVFMIDSLLNAVPNPIYVVAAGGITAWARTHWIHAPTSLPADAAARRRQPGRSADRGRLARVRTPQ